MINFLFYYPFYSQALFFEVHGPKEKSLMYRLLFSRIKGVIATNNFNKEKLLANFAKTKNKVIVMPNSVDVKKFSNLDKVNSRKIYIFLWIKIL